MVDNSFFKQTKEQSEVKARIASKFFDAWSRVMISATRFSDDPIAYIDLFSGPGRYEDGTSSTPLLVLEKAIANPALHERLVTIFNDRDENNVKSLQQEIGKLPGIEKLRHPPRIERDEINEAIVEQFKAHLVPTFSFVDPWGYKGISVDLIRSIIKDFGCDCLFFFNYNRINMGLTNEAIAPHLDALFGKERADRLRLELRDGLSPDQREALIIRALEDAIREHRGEYVLTFRFRTTGNRISHHLVFVTKSRKGYDIMKEVMAGESRDSLEGVPSFEYSELAAREPSLFYETTPLEQLKDDLLKRYAGRTLLMLDLFNDHNVGTPFVKKNYKAALLQLEDAKVITVKSEKKRRKGTCADHCKITFPKRR